MPKDFPRALRVAEQVRRELVVIIRDSVHDPRVKDFSITEVVVSKDLSTAKVYFTPYAQNNEVEALQQGLDSCSPFLRKELGKILHLRIIPSLSFHYDDILDRSARLDDLLSKENLE